MLSAHLSLQHSPPPDTDIVLPNEADSALSSTLACEVCGKRFSGRTARDRRLRHARDAANVVPADVIGPETEEAQKHREYHIRIASRVRGVVRSRTDQARDWYAVHRRELLTQAKTDLFRKRAREELEQELLRTRIPSPPPEPDLTPLSIDKANPFLFIENVLGYYLGDTVEELATADIEELIEESIEMHGASAALQNAKLLMSIPDQASAYIRYKKAKIEREEYPGRLSQYRKNVIALTARLEHPSAFIDEDEVDRRAMMLKLAYVPPSYKKRLRRRPVVKSDIDEAHEGLTDSNEVGSDIAAVKNISQAASTAA